MVRTDRDYKQEAKWAASPEQKKRRAARNRARRKAIREGRAKKGDGKELDHVGYHRTGSLDNVPTKAVSRSANRKRQPPTKAKGKARDKYGK